MPAEATMKVVVLYEDEVRLAATALDKFREILHDDAVSEDAKEAAWTAALHACLVALAGAEDSEATLVLASKADLLGRAARTA